jgi:exodeoxyribonuclease VII small subunit
MAQKKKKAQAKKEELPFEKSLEELEAIVRKLDTESLGVEDAMKEYEKGLVSLKRCRAILDEAEKKLEVLVREEDGKTETRPLAEEGEVEKPEQRAPVKKAKKKSRKGDDEDVKDGFLF